MKKTFIALFLIAFTFKSFGQQKKAVFTEQFKKENRGKYNIEVNELKELLIIMLAITDYGLGNDDMFFQEGDYYQDVLKQFKPYKNEPIILKMDSLMKESPLNYLFFTGNSQTYNFDGDVLKPDDVYFFTADEVAKVKIDKNPITTYKKEIEDFAKKSDFRKFYSNHKDFYNKIYENYEKNVNLVKQWKWLEKNFEAKNDSYVIYTSQLINGLNYTNRYDEKDFKLIEMVLPALSKIEGRTEKNAEAFNTRVMFTEIDHNYVNKPSNKYEKQIDEALKNRDKWVNAKVYGTEYYPTGEHVFNEYMTYGVFILYALDNWKGDTKLLNEIEKEVNYTMVNRGFIKMNEFTNELKKLRAKNKNKKIDKLYPQLVKWCAKQ
ncbi:DUF4932 domain-containing protein [Chryseobacterium manosquense]|uniref:DUF4932 domain-containing protein n=1 Tax=Chryseobacterium manosquense TaxID=2754694 RepID=A0A7H1DXR0_9FLAO|nr:MULTISPECIES: DUF4932 domain-containing protein [Chryseobacterium]QNS41768.1 DUF4932 domain-containing protein [Chryseobacterium manosquense]